jgi:hypothetical protein
MKWLAQPSNNAEQLGKKRGERNKNEPQEIAQRAAAYAELSPR